LTAIADLTDLFVSVAEYANRADFAQSFDRFVKMTEDRLSKALRLDGQQVVVTLTADAQGRVTLPADFREVRSVRLSSGRVLTGGSLDVLDATFLDAGTPCAFAIGGGYINLRPRQATDIELTYMRGVPRLTAASPTNGMLLLYPDCYLWGAVYEVMIWAAARGDASATEKAASVRGLLDEAIGTAIADNEQRMYSQSRTRLVGRWP
jgi:hypothetical protein